MSEENEVVDVVVGDDVAAETVVADVEGAEDVAQGAQEAAE